MESETNGVFLFIHQVMLVGKGVGLGTLEVGRDRYQTSLMLDRSDPGLTRVRHLFRILKRKDRRLQ